MIDTTPRTVRSNSIPGRADGRPLQQNKAPAQPPRLYEIPPDTAAMSLLTMPMASSGASRVDETACAAALVELVGRVLIEKVFFQHLHIPQDLLLSLVNNVIQSVASEQKTKLDVYQEALILSKQLMGKALTPEEQRYEAASKEIDVLGEILNGIKYSALALMGNSLYTSVTSAINQGLWNHVPAIVGYGGAILLGPKLVQAAVEQALAYSGLTTEQKKQLAPWLGTIGRLALGFMPKVKANEQGVTYRHPSISGHTRLVNSHGAVTFSGDQITLEQHGYRHT